MPAPLDLGERPLQALRIGIAAVMMVAFASLARDAPLLMGPDGLLPANKTLSVLDDLSRPDALLHAPSLFLVLTPTDTALRGLAMLGVVGAAALATRTAAWVALPLAWLYLSFTIAGSRLYSFQWDALIVETLVLCVLLGRAPGTVAIWAFRLLLVKLYVESGVAKLSNPAWRELTAMADYWPTVPLPTPLTRLASNLPDTLVTAATLLLEGPALGLTFAGRRARQLLFVLLTALQLGIIATANYGLFNWLSLVLGFALLAEAPIRSRRQLLLEAVPVGAWVLASFITARAWFTDSAGPWADRLQRWRVANVYHLFVDIDPERYEVELLGSEDGRQWRRLPLRSKPPAAPAFIAPYHPRVDFRMWFSTLGGRGTPLGFAARATEIEVGLARLWCADPDRLGLLLTEAERAPTFVTLGYWKARPGISAPWEGTVLGRHPEVRRCGEALGWDQPEALVPLDRAVIFGGG